MGHFRVSCGAEGPTDLALGSAIFASTDNLALLMRSQLILLLCTATDLTKEASGCRCRRLASGQIGKSLRQGYEDLTFLFEHRPPV